MPHLDNFARIVLLANETHTKNRFHDFFFNLPTSVALNSGQFVHAVVG